MRVLRLTLLMVAVALFAAGDKKEAPAEAGKGQPLTLPAEAVKIKPFTYRYKDPAGKVWIYRRTPFGLVRYEEKTGDAKATRKPEKDTGGWKAFDEGDQVRFERQGPFGTYTWRRKKGELTEQERQAWEKTRRRKTPASKAKQE